MRSQFATLTRKIKMLYLSIVKHPANLFLKQREFQSIPIITEYPAFLCQRKIHFHPLAFGGKLCYTFSKFTQIGRYHHASYYF